MLLVATVAFFHESVFPVRDRLECVRPDRLWKNTLGKIVHRHVDTSGPQVIDGPCESVAIVYRIHPKHGIVCNRKTRIFQTHQRDVIDERQITGNPSTGVLDDRRGQRMQDDTDFDPLPPVL